MQMTDRKLLAIISIAVAAVMFFGCLIIGGNLPVYTTTKAAFGILHQVVGATITAIAVGFFVQNYSGKLPLIPFGKAILLLFCGLAIFSLNGYFALAAVAAYVSDCYFDEMKFKAESAREDREKPV